MNGVKGGQGRSNRDVSSCAELLCLLIAGCAIAVIGSIIVTYIGGCV